MAFSTLTGRDENQIARSVCGHVQTADLYIIENSTNGLGWNRLTTATDIDTAETTAKAAALSVNTRITIDGVEYARYGRPSLS